MDDTIDLYVDIIELHWSCTLQSEIVDSYTKTSNFPKTLRTQNGYHGLIHGSSKG